MKFTLNNDKLDYFKYEINTLLPTYYFVFIAFRLLFLLQYCTFIGSYSPFHFYVG